MHMVSKRATFTRSGMQTQQWGSEVTYQNGAQGEAKASISVCGPDSFVIAYGPLTNRRPITEARN